LALTPAGEVIELLLDGYVPYIRSTMWNKIGHTPKPMTNDQLVVLNEMEIIRKARVVEPGPAQKVNDGWLHK
jgi:hypothetical protein